MKKKAFLIHPIRKAEPNYIENIKQQVEHLEKEYEVYFPYRDTNQNATSLEICRQNREAIAKAEVVFFIWDGESTGSLFDLGMAFAMGKKVVPVIGYVPNSTPHKSFQNLVYEWEELGNPDYTLFSGKNIFSLMDGVFYESPF